MMVSPAVCREIWGYGYKGNFWLRSPNDSNDDNAFVGVPGGGNDNNDNVDNDNVAVRPDLPQNCQKRVGKRLPSVQG